MVKCQRPGCGTGPHDAHEDDATIRITGGSRGFAAHSAPPEPVTGKPSLLSSRRTWLAAAGVVGVGCLVGGLWRLAAPPVVAPSAPVAAPPAPLAVATPPPAPAFAIRTATERQILDNVAVGMTVFRFADHQRILVLDFATLRQQGLMLNRVAALIEKSGLPRNRVLTDAELAAAIRAGGDTVETYYYGHDYSAASLQRFFQLIDGEHIEADPEELVLRRLLEQEGWLAPGAQAGLISIPAVGSHPDITQTARATILHHELSHGVFFSDPAYAGFVSRFWDSALSGDERTAVRGFLGSEGYDTTYEELMYNEMQAYLMFTRDPEFFRPDNVRMRPERLAELQTGFLGGMPKGWLRDALAASAAL
jgi:hypothetical protein